MTRPVANRAAQEQAIRAALNQVDDPCSIAARAPLSIVELGLVRSWSLDDDGQVDVTVSPTAPSCVLIASIAAGIEGRVGAVDGVTGVRVHLDTETVWLQEMMTGPGRAKLAHRRTTSLRSVPVRPRQWEESR